MPPTDLAAYEPLCFFSHAGTDTQAAMWRSRDGCTVVVAFRGTEIKVMKDVATDLKLKKQTLNNGEHAKAQFNFVDGKSEPLAQSRVHSGFQEAYASVRRRVRAALDDALAWPGEGGKVPTRLLMTGHSLGAALATLCAVDVAESWQAAAQEGASLARPQLVLHTFGSPRVGDALFVSRFAGIVPCTLRFVAGTVALRFHRSSP